MAFSTKKKGHLLQISYYPSCISSLQNIPLYNEGTVAFTKLLIKIRSPNDTTSDLIGAFMRG